MIQTSPVEWSCSLRWRQTVISSLTSAFSSTWNSTWDPLDETDHSNLQEEVFLGGFLLFFFSKKGKHFTVSRFFFCFLRSGYTTEANCLWQGLGSDRRGGQSEGRLFSPRTEFPIKPPHGPVPILSRNLSKRHLPEQSHCGAKLRITVSTLEMMHYRDVRGPNVQPTRQFSTFTVSSLLSEFGGIFFLKRGRSEGNWARRSALWEM